MAVDSNSVAGVCYFEVSTNMAADHIYENETIITKHLISIDIQSKVLRYIKSDLFTAFYRSLLSILLQINLLLIIRLFVTYF